MDNNDDGAWFAAKNHGYGAGAPIAWQGWAFIAGHVALITGGARMLAHRPAAAVAWCIVIAAIGLPVIAAKTRGGWRWRWGKRD